MPSLKDLRNRIRSVQSTQKITSAMKVVAASRLRSEDLKLPQCTKPLAGSERSEAVNGFHNSRQ